VSGDRAAAAPLRLLKRAGVDYFVLGLTPPDPEDANSPPGLEVSFERVGDTDAFLDALPYGPRARGANREEAARALLAEIQAAIVDPAALFMRLSGAAGREAEDVDTDEDHLAQSELWEAQKVWALAAGIVAAGARQHPEWPLPAFRTFAGLVSLVDPPDPEKLAAKARALGINPEKPKSALWLALNEAEHAQKRERAAREAQAKAVRSRDKTGTKLGEARKAIEQTEDWLRTQAADIDGGLPVAELEPAQLRGVIGVELLRLRRELSEARAEVEAGNARAGELVAERAALRRELEHVATREGLLVADVAEAHRLLEEAGMESKVAMTDAVAAVLAERADDLRVLPIAADAARISILKLDMGQTLTGSDPDPAMRSLERRLLGGQPSAWKYMQNGDIEPIAAAQASPPEGEAPEAGDGNRWGLNDREYFLFNLGRLGVKGADLVGAGVHRLAHLLDRAESERRGAPRGFAFEASRAALVASLPAPPKSGFTPDQERAIGSFVSRVTVSPLDNPGSWQVYLDGRVAMFNGRELTVFAASEESAKNLGCIVLARQERPDLWPTAPEGEG
jgi:hypothetical protein